MSEQLALMALIERKPTERLPKKILADWMMEYHALPRFTALRFAARYGRAVVASRELARAAALLAERSPARWWLFGEIQDAIGRDEEDALEIYLLPGSRPPKAAIVRRDDEPLEAIVYHVFVGARWLLRRAEEMQFEIRDLKDDDSLPFDEPH
jgi:hypothetical protein